MIPITVNTVIKPWRNGDFRLSWILLPTSSWDKDLALVKRIVRLLFVRLISRIVYGDVQRVSRKWNEAKWTANGFNERIESFDTVLLLLPRTDEATTIPRRTDSFDTDFVARKMDILECWLVRLFLHDYPTVLSGPFLCSTIGETEFTNWAHKRW